MRHINKEFWSDQNQLLASKKLKSELQKSNTKQKDRTTESNG